MTSGYSEEAFPEEHPTRKSNIMDVSSTVILSVYGASVLSIVGFYLRRFERRLDSLEANMIRSLERIDNRFERTDDRLNNHGERISTLEGQSREKG